VTGPLRAALSAVLLLAAAGPAHDAAAADRAVRLETPPPLRQDIDAMPRIADPADDAERRINAALTRLDADVLKARKDCKGNDWSRTVAAPMAGPGFLSLTVTDSFFCDGAAHPNSSLYSIVYDLAAGKPVDWPLLLPASLVGKQALEEQSDGARIVTLSSPRLFQLYMQGYTAGGATGDDLKQCKEAVTDMAAGGPPPMMVWLDAGQGGLAVQFDLPHVVKPCEQAVVIPARTLREAGASAALIKALAAAGKP